MFDDFFHLHHVCRAMVAALAAASMLTACGGDDAEPKPTPEPEPSVPGKPGVTLDNKGVHYMGQDGARARSVWDGEVSAIFEMAGSKHVLVRHGSYISVYSGLSSVIVHKGQHVKARDIIGTVKPW